MTLTRQDIRDNRGAALWVGADPENFSRDMIYVGEGDNVFKRLASHDKDVSKEFWTRCVAIISKDLNLTKAHVRYLESRLIEMGAKAGRAKISNGTAPPLPPMPEPDIADMEGFLEYIELMLPVLGFSFLKPRPVAKITANNGAVIQDASPQFHYSSREASAIAQEIDGEFVVLKGSTALKEPKSSSTRTFTARQSRSVGPFYRRDKLLPGDSAGSHYAPQRPRTDLFRAMIRNRHYVGVTVLHEGLV